MGTSWCTTMILTTRLVCACMCVDLCGLCECMRGCVVETANRKEEAIQLFH